MLQAFILTLSVPTIILTTSLLLTLFMKQKRAARVHKVDDRVSPTPMKR